MIWPAVKYDGFRVYTNTPACTAMRGHGGVNIRFAFESVMDMAAEKLGLDPVEIRRRNFLKAPTETINGVKINTYGLPECVDWVTEASGWDERKDNMPANKGLGIALLALYFRSAETGSLDRRAPCDDQSETRLRCRDHHPDRGRRYRSGVVDDINADRGRSVSASIWAGSR